MIGAFVLGLTWPLLLVAAAVFLLIGLLQGAINIERARQERRRRRALGRRLAQARVVTGPWRRRRAA